MVKVIIGNVRFVYINFQHPERYSATVLIPRHDRNTVRQIKTGTAAAIREGLVSRWTDQKAQDIVSPLAVYNDDYYYLNAASTILPGIVDADLQPIKPDDLQSGDRGKVSLSLFPYDSKGRRGIGVGLNNLQILGRG